MANVHASKELLFIGSDLNRPRFTVEREKMQRTFPSFSFYGSEGTINSVRGYLSTRYGNKYYIKMNIPSSYPHNLPTIWAPNDNLGGPHVYTGGNLCVMKSEQWTSIYSLAFMVARSAVWLNKYDIWRRDGRWPGNEQQH